MWPEGRQLSGQCFSRPPRHPPPWWTPLHSNSSNTFNMRRLYVPFGPHPLQFTILRGLCFCGQHMAFFAYPEPWGWAQESLLGHSVLWHLCECL